MATPNLLLLSTITLIIHTVGPAELLRLSTDAADLASASLDFGRLANPVEPLAVFRPKSTADVAAIVNSAAKSGLAVSARGHGHSINGQAHTAEGVVVEMSRREKERGINNVVVNAEKGYADVWGGEMWVDVLRCTLQYGLAPRSWTDYLYLTVGGTLSNAGISGQAFNHGPQINNVYQLHVVTGVGEVMTCSEDENSELFHAVLGGLGQFGIITRARVALEPAPQRVRWIRVLYSDFTAFTEDQEYLISLHEKASTHKFDYVEGFVIVDEGLINNWRSSFFSPRNPFKISSLGANNNGGVLYCLEVTKNYFDSASDTIDQMTSNPIEGAQRKTHNKAVDMKLFRICFFANIGSERDIRGYSGKKSSNLSKIRAFSRTCYHSELIVQHSSPHHDVH